MVEQHVTIEAIVVPDLLDARVLQIRLEDHENRLQRTECVDPNLEGLSARKSEEGGEEGITKRNSKYFTRGPLPKSCSGPQ
jgi:hypothetical protein